MSNRATIVDRLLAGDEYDLEKIDEEIELWHESKIKVPLYAWLGFTREEYSLFVEKPDLIRTILAARRYGISAANLAQAPDLPLAARGVTRAEVKELHRWLQTTGRL